MDTPGLQFGFHSPAPELRTLIRGYWHLSSNKSSIKRVVNRVFPDGYTDILFNFGDPLLQKINSATAIVDKDPAFISGIMTSTCLVGLSGTVDLFGISIQPGQAGRLLGIPIHLIAGSRIELFQTRKAFTDGLMDKLAKRCTLNARTAVMDQFFLQQMHLLPESSPALDWSIAQINQHHGILDIRQLLTTSGYSPRQQQRMFREHLGLGPKHYARIIRFKKAMRLLENPDRPLPSLALDLGFCDQAHLSREIREISGLTPGLIRGKERSSLLYTSP